jgi:Aldehyde dehydrogenase family
MSSSSPHPSVQRTAKAIPNEKQLSCSPSAEQQPFEARREKVTTMVVEWTQEQIDAEVVRLELTGENLSTVVETRPFINGVYYDGEIPYDTIITSFNPATGRNVAMITACNDQLVDMAVSAARTSFESGVWSNKSPEERKNILLKFAQLIEEHTLELAVLDAVEGNVIFCLVVCVCP